VFASENVARTCPMLRDEGAGSWSPTHSAGPCRGSCAMQGWANEQAQRRLQGSPHATITPEDKEKENVLKLH